ncbi:MAG TPA: hypothetical protein VN631_01570 [Negativicutes bacterium]|nr:hypothetical protein [Negativicutes bacterium]
MQVLIPRTIDVAKTAAVNEQQPVTQQQQLAAQLKQTVAEQQRQVQTKLSAQHDGKVTTEDLDHEKQKDHRQSDGQDPENAAGAESDAAGAKVQSLPPDPVRGHTIDIKT